jgi:hypothetical protein
MPWGANTGRTAPGRGFDTRHSRQPLDPEHHLPSGMRGWTSRPTITDRPTGAKEHDHGEYDSRPRLEGR